MKFKSGFITIIGKPNVGKSTLMNKILGEKISITAPKPQTTRDRILGIYNDEESQIIFLDTPGIHFSGKALNKYMFDKALSAIEEADLILFMSEPSEGIESIGKIYELIRGSEKETLFVLNKSDLLSPESAEKKVEEVCGAFDFSAARHVSSMTGEGIVELVALIKQKLNEGPRYFPEDMITDLSERFLVGEIIREKVFNLTRQEIPYSTAVEIEKFIEGDPTTIYAAIHIEKDSQKGIVLGKNGAMIKEIGIEARRDIERLVGCHVILKLFVKVTKDWSKDTREMKRLGYN